MLNKSIKDNIKQRDFASAQRLERILQKAKRKEEKIVLKQLTLVQERQRSRIEEKIKGNDNTLASSQLKHKELFAKRLNKMQNDLKIKHQIEIDNYQKDFEQVNPKHPHLLSELLARNELINESVKEKNFTNAIKYEEELREFKRNAEEMYEKNRKRKLRHELRKLIDNQLKEEIELNKHIEKLKKETKSQRRKSFSHIENKNIRKIELLKTIHSGERNHVKDTLYTINVKEHNPISARLKIID